MWDNHVEIQLIEFYFLLGYLETFSYFLKQQTATRFITSFSALVALNYLVFQQYNKAYH